MRLTKLEHACVRLEKDGAVLVLDPGVWTGPEALERAGAVLITHEHFDHLNADVLRAELAANPALQVWANASVAGQFAEFTGVLVWQRERAAAQCLRRHVQQQRLGGETIADERADVVLDRIGVDRVAVCLGSGQRHPLQVAGYVLAGFRAVSGDHLVHDLGECDQVAAGGRTRPEVGVQVRGHSSGWAEIIQHFGVVADRG